MQNMLEICKSVRSGIEVLSQKQRNLKLKSERLLVIIFMLSTVSTQFPISEHSLFCFGSFLTVPRVYLIYLILWTAFRRGTVTTWSVCRKSSFHFSHMCHTLFSHMYHIWRFVQMCDAHMTFWQKSNITE